MRLSARRRQRMRFRDTGVEPRRANLPGGGSVEVVRLGQGDPILLVPGLAGGWRLLAPLARRLARRHEVVLVGLRGDEGLLTTTPAGGVGDYARDVAALIEQMGLERPTVLGVSFGGAVALELAADHPSLVGGLILHGAAASFRMGMGATIALRVLERLPLPRDSAFINQFFNILYGCRPEPGPLVDFVVERCWETDQGVMAGRLRALESFDVSDRLWRIEAPTAVLAGARDVVVSPSRQQALAEGIAGARFATIPGAGHVGFLTHGAEVARHAERHAREAHRSAI